MQSRPAKNANSIADVARWSDLSAVPRLSSVLMTMRKCLDLSGSLQIGIVQ